MFDILMTKNKNKIKNICLIWARLYIIENLGILFETNQAQTQKKLKI